MKFCDNVGDPSRFPTPLPGCLCHVLFCRYLPLSLEVIEKPNQCKRFWPPFFSGGMTPTFLWYIVIAIYPPQFTKVWLSSVCWCPSAKHGNEVESIICVEWVKIRVQFEAVSEAKFMTFRHDVGDPCRCQRTYPIMYRIVFRSEDIGR